MNFPILSTLVAIPIIGSLILGFLGNEQKSVLRVGSVVLAAINFVVSLLLLSGFQSGTMHFQFQERAPWIPQLGIEYHLGVDGISIWLIILSTFLTLICSIFSRYVENRVKAYHVLLHVLSAATLGVFMSLDMILFFVFFEATLIPMYFLIAIWGGANRAYASIKFFLFTAAGSIFMLLGMITLSWLYANATHGAGTFDLLAIQEKVANGELWAGAMHLQALVFWSFAIGFLVKVPAFPFHTWLPDAHVEAPTAGSVILAGVLLKMGTYGFLRFCLPLFPDVIGQNVVPIMILAVFGIIYGGAVAAVQPDVKKLVAYSSVAHMGFVMIGILSLTHEGLVGGSYQQLNHGIATGCLFLLIGLIYERTHTRKFADYGGLKAQMPIFSALFMLTMWSSVGLPGMNGFIGEFLALMGTFRAGYAGFNGLSIAFGVIAATGVIVAAVYLLVMFMRMFYGPNANPDNHRLKDLKPWEIGIVGSLVVLMFWGGIYPSTFIKPTESALGAVRLMAINPVGMRPVWNRMDQEIDSTGQLVLVDPRMPDSKTLGSYNVRDVISPNRMNFETVTAPVSAQNPDTLEVAHQ